MEPRSDGKESACNTGDWVWSLGQEDPPGKENGYPLQYSCLEISMDRGAWWAIYSPWGLKESDITKWLTHTQLFHPHVFSITRLTSLPQSSSLPCLCLILVQAITTCSLVLRIAAPLNPSHPARVIFSNANLTSVQFSCSVVSDSLRPHELQRARPPCPSSTPGVYSNSCPSKWWCHLAISSSVIPFSSCFQSLPASGSFPMSQLFAWGGLKWSRCLTWPKPCPACSLPAPQPVSRSHCSPHCPSFRSRVHCAFVTGPLHMLFCLIPPQQLRFYSGTYWETAPKR